MSVTELIEHINELNLAETSVTDLYETIILFNHRNQQADLVLSFGKYKGTKISDMGKTYQQRQYLSWLRSQKWLTDENIIAAIDKLGIKKKTK